MSLVPSPEESRRVTVHATELEPSSPSDSASIWRQFLDTLRQAIGLKPLYLAERFAEAKVLQEETAAFKERADAEARLLEAKNGFEVAKAEAQLRSAAAAKTKAETRKANAEARQQEINNKLHNELVQRLLDRVDKGEAIERLQDTIKQIHMLGGYVEFGGLDDQAEE